MPSAEETGSGFRVAVTAAVLGLSYVALLALRRRNKQDAVEGMELDKMATWWTPELKATYARDGYVVLRGYLTQQEVGILRAQAERAMDGFQWYPGFEGIRKNLQTGDAFFGGQLMRGAHRPILEGLLDDELVPAGAAFFDKPLERNCAVEPHRDGDGHINGATFWIALDDADESNGCLHYTPGSHLNAEKMPQLGAGQAPEGRTGGKAISVTAGDAIIHCSRTVHFSEKAAKPKRRRAVSYFYWSGQSAKKLEAAGKGLPGGRAVL